MSVQDYSGLAPGNYSFTVSLGSTAGLLTLFKLPGWIGRTVTTIASGGADVKKVAGTQQPEDNKDIGGREYKTIFIADGPRVDRYRSGPGRPSISKLRWPPMFALAPASATATTITIELEPWHS